MPTVKRKLSNPIRFVPAVAYISIHILHTRHVSFLSRITHGALLCVEKKGMKETPQIPGIPSSPWVTFFRFADIATKGLRVTFPLGSTW